MINVYVNKTHIENGKKARAHCCPIALSLLDKGFTTVSVAPRSGVAADTRGNWYKFDLPSKAQTFVSTFDSGHEVKPFSFRLKMREYPCD